MPLLRSGLGSTSESHAVLLRRFHSNLITSVYYGFAHNDDPSTFVSTLLDKYRPLVEQLYTDGVRKFLFLNCPPSTRSPQVHEENDLPEQFERHAVMVTAYNDGLKDMVQRFSDDHEDVSTSLLSTRYISDRMFV
jgi:hypothetical protein